MNSEYLNVAPYEKIDKDKEVFQDVEEVIDNEAISNLIKYISSRNPKRIFVVNC